MQTYLNGFHKNDKKKRYYEHFFPKQKKYKVKYN
jgi:hypothetical protein